VIEEAVLKGIDCFLRDRLRLIKRLKLSNASPAHLGPMFTGAASLADRITKSGPAEQRRILLEMLENIDVRQDRVGIVLRTNALRSMIGEDVQKQQHQNRSEQPEHTYTLDLPVSFRRRGVEMKLAITDDQQKALSPDPKLIAAIGQARNWFAELKDGKTRSVSELAKRYRVDRGDVGKALKLAFLAPDIVQAIVEGRQPVDLTAARLTRLTNLPASWEDQRRLLGFGR
jgi:hypothetical protein